MDGPATTAKQRRAERRKAKSARRKAKKLLPAARTPAQQFEIDVATGRASKHHLESRRYKATRRCCSSRWADDHWHGELHVAKKIVWHTPVEYPPGGVHTKMVRCLACGRDTPPQCVVRHDGTQLCQDCAMSGFQPAELSSHTVVSEARLSWCGKRGETYDGLY